MERQELTVNETGVSPENTGLSIQADEKEVVSTLTKINNVGLAIKSALKENEDWGYVKGIAKPFLFKAGAMKIALMFGITSTSTIEFCECDREKNIYFYRTKVQLFKNGMLLHEGLGAYDTREVRLKPGSRPTPENTAIKMSEKRAFVDAVLKLSNLSQLFNQDEDCVEVQERPQPQLQPKKEIKISAAKL